MDRSRWIALLADALDDVDRWERAWPDLEPVPVDEAARSALSALTERLRDNYPFGHPSYAGQMLKPPHPIAWAAWATAMTINPNNHALDGGPATAALEREAVAGIASMLGVDPTSSLGHLTSSGTIANLEALWVARHERPGAIAFSESAHYTHGRMAEVLGMPTRRVAAAVDGTMRVAELAQALAAGGIGTVVATAGTTGLGAIDDIGTIADLCEAHGVRLHVDAAYGGYFALLAQRKPPLVDAARFAAIARADSVVIDPHKHGLQPYGCGCVLFRDASVGRHYKHDSPYTYFTSSDLHLGEISLECSRAGAAAAALWATMQAIPLTPHGGMGDRLAAGRRAALAWHAALEASDVLVPVTVPATDIVAFAPRVRGRRTTAAEVSAASRAVFERGMRSDDGFYLALLSIDAGTVLDRWPELDAAPGEPLVVLRSTLMKPEHEAWWPALHERIEREVQAVLARSS